MRKYFLANILCQNKQSVNYNFIRSIGQHYNHNRVYAFDQLYRPIYGYYMIAAMILLGRNYFIMQVSPTKNLSTAFQNTLHRIKYEAKACIALCNRNFAADLKNII